MPCRRDADAFRANTPAAGVDADHPATLFDEVDDLAVLDDVHSEGGSGPRVPPGDRVMPRRSGTPLGESAEHRQPCVRRKIQSGSERADFIPGQDLRGNAVHAHRIGPARHGIQIVAAVRQQYQPALAQHDVEIQRLRKALV